MPLSELVIRSVTRPPGPEPPPGLPPEPEGEAAGGGKLAMGAAFVAVVPDFDEDEVEDVDDFFESDCFCSDWFVSPDFVSVEEFEEVVVGPTICSAFFAEEALVFA